MTKRLTKKAKDQLVDEVLEPINNLVHVNDDMFSVPVPRKGKWIVWSDKSGKLSKKVSRKEWLGASTAYVKMLCDEGVEGKGVYIGIQFPSFFQELYPPR